VGAGLAVWAQVAENWRASRRDLPDDARDTFFVRCIYPRCHVIPLIAKASENETEPIGPLAMFWRRTSRRLSELSEAMDAMRMKMIRKLQGQLQASVLPRGPNATEIYQRPKLEDLAMQHNLWEIDTKTAGKVQAMSVVA
jgi:hypothetical protein